jgi:hypothetical protein
MLVTLKELQMATLHGLPLFIFCSALVSALVIMLIASPCERIGKREHFPILKEDGSLANVCLEHLR